MKRIEIDRKLKTNAKVPYMKVKAYGYYLKLVCHCGHECSSEYVIPCPKCEAEIKKNAA